MRSVLWLLLGLVIGCVAGWYVRVLAEPEVRTYTDFRFNDKLADPQFPYLSAEGTWRGDNLAQKINTVRILCDASETNCDMHQADVTSMSGKPWLSLHNTSFRITKIDTQMVVAETRLPDVCIRRTLMFDRVAKAVTFVRTKINRDDACSLVQDEPVTLFLGKPL